VGEKRERDNIKREEAILLPALQEGKYIYKQKGPRVWLGVVGGRGVTLFSPCPIRQSGSRGGGLLHDDIRATALSLSLNLSLTLSLIRLIVGFG